MDAMVSSATPAAPPLLVRARGDLTDAELVRIVGGKALNLLRLSEMLAAPGGAEGGGAVVVPAFFTVTTEAFQLFKQENDLAAIIRVPEVRIRFCVCCSLVPLTIPPLPPPLPPPSHRDLRLPTVALPTHPHPHHSPFNHPFTIQPLYPNHPHHDPRNHRGRARPAWPRTRRASARLCLRRRFRSASAPPWRARTRTYL